MTYDALPTTTPTEVRAKFDKLWTTYNGPKPTTVTSTTFTKAIVSRLMLIYELWGEQLVDEHSDTDQAHRVMALYRTHPDIHPSCLNEIEVPAPPASCTTDSVNKTRGDLIRCQRLFGPHASESVASVALSSCENVLTGYLDLAATPTADSACGGPLLRMVAAKAALQLLDKQFGMIASAPTTLGKLSRQLWLLDRWYEVSKRADGLGVFPAPDQQQRDTSFVLGRFWSSVHRRSNVDGALTSLGASATNQDAENALGLTAVRGRQGEQGVVTAMFTDTGIIQPENVTVVGPPLHGLPLLALLGDALKPLGDDLDGLAVYHDIACQFRDCRAPATNTPSRNAWSILSKLEASPGLQTAVNSNPHALAGWKAVFNAIAGKQAVLAQAIAQAVTGPGGLADARTEAAVAPLARPLWTLYQHARAFHNHYEATGLFESTAQNQIHGSLLAEDQIANVQKLRARVARLGDAVTEYQGNVLDIVRAQLAVLDTGASIQHLTNQRLRKAEEIEQKSANLEGLRDSGEAEADAFGSLAASFATIQGALSTGAFVDVGNPLTFELSGDNAMFTSSRKPADVASRTIAGLAAGQMLLVQTTGKWKPTCAIGDVRFFKPDGLSDVGADLTQAEIGPEGYSVSWTGTTYKGQSSAGSTEHSRTVGASIKLCQDTGAVGEVYGVKAEACVYADQHVTWSDSTTSNLGSDRRTGASFATGLRLNETPFPDAPVGSLLVVLTEPSTGVVRDIRVVREGGTSILVEQSSDAYFVINDKRCDARDAASILTVTARTMSSETAVATASLGAMVDVLAFMRAQQDILVNQGTLLANQNTSLRQQAYTKLQSRLGSTPLSALPGPLASLFEAFVTHEIVATERRIEMRAIERSLDLDLIDLRIVDDEIKTGTTRTRLQSLLPRWLVRDLDHDSLRRSLVDVLDVARDNLKPILELWYPHALDQVSVGLEINTLVNADVDASLITLADNGQRFVNALLDAYEDGTFGNKPQAPSLPFVLISFPRPGADVSNSGWRKVDEARAKRAWDAVLARKKARFEISPEDFYSLAGGDAVLTCHEVVPVIRTMGFFAARPGDDAGNTTINHSGRTMVGAASDTQSFITPEGPRVYQFADAVWQNFVLPVRYGVTESALAVFETVPRQTRPVGLSPNGMFELDFSVLAQQSNTGFELDAGLPVTEIVLVIEIDSRASAATPTWVKRCQ